MKKRTEKDSIGKIEVDANKYWGAQTQRSLENFDIGFEKMPWEIIESFAVLKMAAANRITIMILSSNHNVIIPSLIKSPKM